MSKTIINTSNAPEAIGPYSQAIKIGNILFCSGQIPINPTTGEIEGKDVQAQAHQVLKNIQAVLESAGYCFDEVVKTTCFLTNMDDFVAFNPVYANYFVQNQPARSTVAVKTLPKNALVEIEVIAMKT